MERAESTPDAGYDNRESVDVEEALIRAGLFDTRAPRKGKKAHDKLVETAKNYIEAVKLIEKPPSTTRSDSENYFNRAGKGSSFSETKRRKYHDQLIMMLFGSERKNLPKKILDQVSDFAAYLSGGDEYVGSW